MEQHRTAITASVRTEGGLLPADLLAKIVAADTSVPGLAPVDFGLPAGERTREAITRSWNRLVGAWASLVGVRVEAKEDDPLIGPTRERFLLPLFDELGFGRLPVARAVEIEGRSYPISHGWSNAKRTVAVPVHLTGFGVDLDHRSPGVRGAAGAAPHALVQEYLNRIDDALWGALSNGRTLRLLRDSTSLTRSAFVEFDLEAIFEGELYADFALLWTVCHRSRFDADRPTDCLLEQWTKKAAEDGTRALDRLRGGVERAIETLGAGFLAHPDNGTLREALRTGVLDRQDYYRELLRLVYRLIFLFTAEDRRDEETGRELLLDPAAPDDAVERYRASYSTARLRSLAVRRRGTRHGDQWIVLRKVIAALGGPGAPSIALPALGSFLFGPEACPDLDRASLRNEDLLAAVRALAEIEEDKRRRSIDYRNLGAEELGSVYEGLLELRPRIEMEANPPRFELSTAAGNERKATGSYYTPSSLISCLLDSALDPVVDEAIAGTKGADAEAALLGLAVVDPAAGSGHFLVAAAHRLAKRLAAIRTDEAEPPPSSVRHALRDVIAHCIYAVDINPMAVELCKVSLWLEALEPGRPLSFLDAHIRCGNSLLGTTPELAAAGIPDAAYEAITGDDRAVARSWRDRNRRERVGQQALFEASLEIPTDALAREVRSLDGLPEETLEAAAAKAARHAGYVASADYRRARAALDAWCAAFVAPKTPGSPEITTATVRAIGANPDSVPSAVRDLVAATAADYAFLHWLIEFPAVFARGGFNVVLGNPPWERIKLQEQEFFAERSADIAGAGNAAERKRLITALEATDPALWQSYRAALRRTEGEGHILRDSGRYPLAGRGDINTYAVFAELMRGLPGLEGRVGMVVPSGIATDDTTKYFFGDVVEKRLLASLYSFENEEKVFAGVHNEFKFCLLTLAGAPLADPADLVFFARQVDALGDSERHFSLTPADFALLNPNTRTCPTFRGHADAELAKAIYRRVPVLVEGSRGVDGDPWQVSFLRMFDMTNDSGLFHNAPGPDLAPLYEAKMAHQFDHRYGSYEGQTQAQANKGVLPQVPETHKVDPGYQPRPRYWVDRSEVDRRLDGHRDREWLLAFRDVTNSVSVRTVVASALPRAGVGNQAPLVFCASELESLMLLANLNAFVLDWVARQKLGGAHLNYFLLHQLPVLPPWTYRDQVPGLGLPLGDWIRYRVAELVATGWDVVATARALGWTGSPFRWSGDRREVIRAELDAVYFRSYGIGRDDVARILDSFWIVREQDTRAHGMYKTKDLVLEAYDALLEATADRPFVSRLDPPPGHPRAAHPQGPGEDPGRWAPWEEVVVREPRAEAPISQRRATPVVTPTTRAVDESAAAVPSVRAQAPTLALNQGVALESTGNGWLPETSVDPAALVLGTAVSHRSFGLGTLLSISSKAGSTQLLVRFDTSGEKWIAFGLGLLEFAADA